MNFHQLSWQAQTILLVLWLFWFLSGFGLGWLARGLRKEVRTKERQERKSLDKERNLAGRFRNEVNRYCSVSGWSWARVTMVSSLREGGHRVSLKGPNDVELIAIDIVLSAAKDPIMIRHYAGGGWMGFEQDEESIQKALNCIAQHVLQLRLPA